MCCSLFFSCMCNLWTNHQSSFPQYESLTISPKNSSQAKNLKSQTPKPEPQINNQQLLRQIRLGRIILLHLSLTKILCLQFLHTKVTTIVCLLKTRLSPRLPAQNAMLPPPFGLFLEKSTEPLPLFKIIVHPLVPSNMHLTLNKFALTEELGLILYSLVSSSSPCSKASWQSEYNIKGQTCRWLQYKLVRCVAGVEQYDDRMMMTYAGCNRC